MIYLFDNQDKLIDIIAEEDLIDWTYTVEINAFDEAEFELPIDYKLDLVKESVYFGFFGRKDEFKVFRITEKLLKDERIIKGLDRAESDLRTVSIIKEKRPQNVTADQALHVALENTGYEVGNVEGLPLLGKTNFYYISPREALVKIIETWNCEFRVRYTFVENKISSRYIDLFKREGKATGRQFYHGDDLLSIEHEESSDDVVTALIGRGKGEEITGEDGQATGGYGRRIEFTDIVWSKLSGKPTDKPAGQNYVVSEAAREKFGLYQNGQVKHRWGVFIDEQIEDKELLLQRTWEELQKLSIPITTYKASLVEISPDIWKGDSVAIIRDDIGIAFEARIHKIVIDKLNNDRSTVELGDYATLRERHSTGRAVQQAMNEALDAQSQDLQEFLLRLEEEKARKNAEIDEKFRLARLNMDNAIEGIKNEAEQGRAELAEEIEGKLAEHRTEAEQAQSEFMRRLDSTRQDLENLESGLSQDFTRTIEEASKGLNQQLEGYREQLNQASREASQAMAIADSVSREQAGFAKQLSKQAADNEGWRSSFESAISDELGTYKREFAQIRGKFDSAGNLTALENYKRTLEEDARGVQAELQKFGEYVKNDGTRTRELKQNISKETTELVKRELKSTVEDVSGLTTLVNSIQKTAEGTKTELATYKQGESGRTEQLQRYVRTETAAQVSAARTALGEGFVAKSSYDEDVRGIRRQFSEMKIGGRNILKKTRTFTEVAGSSELLSNTYRDCAIRYFKNTNASSSYQDIALYQNALYPELGGTYTLSFWAKGIGSITTYFYGTSGYLQVSEASSNEGVTNAKPDGAMAFTLSSDWKRYSVVYQLKSAPASAAEVYKHVLFRHIGNSTSEKVWLAGVKLEQGTIPTDWSPAPEDSEAAVTALTQNVATYIQKTDQFSNTLTEVRGAIPKTIGGRNILLNGNFDKISESPRFTVAGTTYSTRPQGWSTYNGGIANAATNFHAYVADGAGRTSIGVFNESNGQRNWKAFQQTVGERMPQTTNDFVFSVDCYATGAGTKLFGGLYYCDQSGNRNFHSGQFQLPVEQVNAWHRLSVKVPFNNARCDFSKGISFYIYGYGFTSNSVLYIDNVQLEEGTIATAYNAAPEDVTSVLSTVSSKIEQVPEKITAAVNALSGNVLHKSEVKIEQGRIQLGAGKVVDGNTLTSLFSVKPEAITALTKLFRITGDMMVDGTITAKQLNINSARAGILTANSITTTMLNAQAVTGEKIKFDQGFFNRFMAEDAYLKQVFAKQAFITQVQAVNLSASKITSGVLSAKNGVTNFNLDDGKLNFNSNNTGVFRVQENASTQGMMFLNNPIYVDGKNRINSKAIIGAERRGNNLQTAWNRGGFNGIIIDTISGVGTSAHDNADKVTVVADRIDFTHTYSLDGENNKFNKPTGWRFLNYTGTTGGVISIEPRNINPRNSHVVVGDIRLMDDDNTGYWLKDILRSLANMWGHYRNMGGPWNTTSPDLQRDFNYLKKVFGI